MRNPLQDQLLKAGLVKKSKVAQVVREQTRQREGKLKPPVDQPIDTARLQAERAERDRALQAERNAQLRAAEQHAQVSQIIEAHKLKREGDIAYRFTDGASIKSILVNPSLRAQLASGSLVIARHGDGHELLPRAAADKIYSRDPTAIVLDHGGEQSAEATEEDAYYRQFEVPDDLIW